MTPAPHYRKKSHMRWQEGSGLGGGCLGTPHPETNGNGGSIIWLFDLSIPREAVGEWGSHLTSERNYAIFMRS